MSDKLPILGLVRDGEPVSGGVDGRPIRRLSEQLNYVWSQLQAAGAGASLRAARYPCNPDCLVGGPVYLDPATGRFEPALASATVDAGGRLTLAESGRASGVVRYKPAADLADVTLSGFDVIDFSAAADSYAAGDYWVSARTAGRLTATRPPAGGFVLRHFGSGLVQVGPLPADLADRHVHYPFELYAYPAGVVEEALGRYAFTETHPGVGGWLPASEFANAPSGAAYGYNLAAHPALQALWPPAPLAGAYLEWDRDGVSGYLGVPSAYFRVDRNGLWWLSDCVGEAPWPAAVFSDFSESASDSASDTGDCPTPGHMRLRLWFTKPQLGSSAGLVTSLTSTDDRVRVRCANGAEGSAGDLVIALDLNFLLADGGSGYKAVLGLSADGETLLRAPVATGVYSTSAGVTLSGDATSRLTDDASPTVHHGRIRVTLDPSPTHQISPEIYRLDGATTEFTGGVPYVGLPPGENSSVLARFRVPDDLAYASPALTLRLRLVASAVGTPPDLDVARRRIPAPAGVDTLPVTGDFSVVLVTTRTITTAPSYYDVEAEPFAVAAGDTVLVTIARDDSDGYAGTAGILDLTGTFAEAA